jgi:hypothetical protein
MAFNLAVIVYALQQRICWLLNYAKVTDHELGSGIIIVNELVTVASYYEIALWDSYRKAEGIHTIII